MELVLEQREVVEVSGEDRGEVVSSLDDQDVGLGGGLVEEGTLAVLQSLADVAQAVLAVVGDVLGHGAGGRLFGVEDLDLVEVAEGNHHGG